MLLNATWDLYRENRLVEHSMTLTYLLWGLECQYPGKDIYGGFMQAHLNYE